MVIVANLPSIGSIFYAQYMQFTFYWLQQTILLYCEKAFSFQTYMTQHCSLF